MVKMGYTLKEFWGQFHGFKVERIGSVRVILNIEHVEMTFLPATRRGFELWNGGNRIFGHEDLGRG